MNFTLEKLKEARDAGISDEVIWNTAIKADQRFSQAKEKNIPLETAFGAYQQSLGQPTQPAAPATFAEGAEDIGRKFLMGGVGGIRSITNILGASNPLSKSLAGVEDYIAEGLSAESQGNSRAISELFQKVEEKGLWDKFQAGLEAFKMAPGETLAQTAGYMIPNLVAGLAGKAAQFGRAGLTAVQAGVGATMGAGIVKGEIYEGTYEYLKQSGLSEEEARKRADEAQASLGKNLDQIFLAAGLGAVASTTGAEKIITRMLSRTGKEVSERSIKEVLKAGLGGAAGEAVFETIQEGQEKVASNKALQREGADVDTFAGVPQVMGMAAPAAAILGGGAGAISVLSTPEQAAERRIERDSNQAARELSVPAGDTTGQIIVNDIGQKENEIANLKEALQEQDINSPQGQELLLAIRYAETQLNALKKQAGETVESEQARLAREIATPVESTVQQDLTVQTTPDTTATTAEATTVTPAPVSETITEPAAATLQETRMAAPARVEEKVEPIPEGERYTLEEVTAAATRIFGGTLPDRIKIITDTDKKENELKAGYDPNNGEITLNLAYIPRTDKIDDIINHEIGHFVYGDPSFQNEFKAFWDSIPDNAKGQINDIINSLYNEKTNQIQIEERQVQAFASLIKSNREERTTWQKLKDWIKKWLNKTFNTKFEVNDENALAVLAAGFKRFKSGEQIVRAMDEGTLQMARRAKETPAAKKRLDFTQLIP
jgi:hypothetical protein